MILSFVLIVILVAALTALGLYSNLQAQVLDEFQLRANSTARLTALAQSGDDFVNIQSAGDPLYEQFRVRNSEIQDGNPEIIKLLLLRKDDQGFYVVIDPAEQNAATFGDRYPSGSVLEQHYDSLTTAFSDPQISTTGSESTLSAYAPIFDSAGQRIGAAVVTLDANSVIQKQNQALTASLSVLIGVILFGVLLGYIVSSSLANPILKLARTAHDTASGQRQRHEQVNTGDEVEDLARSFSSMSDQLKDVVQSLEARVRDRSREASDATDQAQRRVLQLETVSEVARTITSVRDLDQILPAIARLISQKFGYYHVGIFLVDDRQEYALLRAANSVGGRKMIERGHKLKVEPTSIVGYAASLGAPRVALDVGADSVFLKNPDLPETRSELALPLMVAGIVIGVLDVQSIEPDAFPQEEVSALNVLANQVATALENARLFSETRASLDDARKTSRDLVGRDWSTYYRWLSKPGYKYDGANLKSIEGAPDSAEIRDVALQGESMISVETSKESKMIVPIKLRGEVIGVLSVEGNGAGRKWSREEVALAQAAAERASLALENARLVHEAQRRAAKERTIGEISGKIGSLIDIDNILQMAAQELGRTMPGSEVVIQFQGNGK
jgi:GAF domain-containing protein/HAMP domain-containing protein